MGTEKTASTANMASATSTMPLATPDQQLEILRQLVCGDDYQRMITLGQTLSDESSRQQYFADVIAEAISIRSASDDSVAVSLAPILSESIHSSIRSDPESVSEALYPVMGPAIRKSITETIQTLFDGFNRALENSLSLRSLGWRLDAWRTGKSYSEVVLLKTLNYRVEEVFLIHKETGLLIHQVAPDLGISKDADMMSAMLTAIQDFITDSFEVSDDERLHSMKMGNLTILLEPGPSAVLAVAVRGTVSSDYRALMVTTQEQCHRRYTDQLRQFDGDSTHFRGIEDLLRVCLKEELQQPAKSRKVPVYGIIGLLIVLSGLGWWSYQGYLSDQRWTEFVERLEEQPGLLVRSTNSFGRQVSALRDPDADSALFEQEAEALGYRIDWQEFVSVDDVILERRLAPLLSDQVTLSIHNGEIRLSGLMSQDDIREWGYLASAMPGIQALDLSQVQAIEPLQQQQLMNRIESFRYFYDVSAYRIDPQNSDPQNSDRQQALDTLLNDIMMLAETLDSATESLSIQTVGFSDDTGSASLRETISYERAQHLRQYLIEQGVPEHLIRADIGLADDQSLQGLDMNQRRQSAVRIVIKPVDKLRALQ